LLSEIFGLAWKRLLVITGVIGDAQGRLIALLFYFTVLVPFGIGSRMLSDPLRRNLPADQSAWVDRAVLIHTVEEAKKQG
jgi:hypothetical protein